MLLVHFLSNNDVARALVSQVSVQRAQCVGFGTGSSDHLSIRLEVNSDNTFTLANLYRCLLSKWKCSLNVTVPLGVFFCRLPPPYCPRPVPFVVRQGWGVGTGKVSLLLITY